MKLHRCSTRLRRSPFAVQRLSLRPRSLPLLANLTEIDVDSNFLAGPLPAEWGCLRQLIEIDISTNLLTGTVPPEWGLLSR